MSRVPTGRFETAQLPLSTVSRNSTKRSPLAPLHLPAPPLTDGSVSLRPWTSDDAASLLRIAREPDVDRWTYLSRGWSLGDANRWIENRVEAQRAGSGVALAICRRESGTVIGNVGLGGVGHEHGAEIFYWLDGSARGHGYASAAVTLVAEWAFESLGLPRLFLHVEPENASSRKLAERARFEHEGTLRQAGVRVDGTGRVDLCVYGLLPSDLERG